MTMSTALPPSPEEEHIFFPSSEKQPIQIEGRFAMGSLPFACVLCHPHPLHGGSLDNKVIDAAMRTLVAKGFSALRFNFRGVGKSEGSHGHGQAEMRDLMGAIDYIQNRTHTQTLLLVGYSFGTGVISRFLERGGETNGAILIAPPLDMYKLPSFQTPDRWGVGAIVGDNDEFCTVEQFQTYLAQFGTQARAQVVPQTDHFFHGKLPALVGFLQTMVGDLRT